jgi:AbrB family looped-hinge helix DNA binding protein
MRVTSKGQVTIPQHIRRKLGIARNSEVEFLEEGDRVYLVRKGAGGANKSLAALRAVATVKMTTEEIMKLTRGGE